jgi:hypothetical protein
MYKKLLVVLLLIVIIVGGYFYFFSPNAINKKDITQGPNSKTEVEVSLKNKQNSYSKEDKEIIRIAETASYTPPSDFYKEESTKGSVYYVNTIIARRFLGLNSR